MNKQKLRKDAKELLKEAERLGFEFAGRTRNGHIKLRNKSTGQIVFASSTASDYRSRKNSLAFIKRIA